MDAAPNPRWLNAQEARAWRSFMRLRAQLNAHLNRQLQQDSQMSHADFEVMVILSEAPEMKLRAFQLGKALQWEKSRLSHHLKRMEKRGLIRRLECPSDARGAYVELTEEGFEAIKDAAPMHVETVREYFVDLLTPDQLDELAKICEAALEKLESHSGDICNE